jgi:ABC-type branched-subunit amino acid transport system substrate-binding protein
MVENDKVFMLIGAAGADQITSCARYAESVGVPYLSAGVNTDGLSGLKNYFAISQTYAQQAPILAGLIKNKIGKTKVGLAVLDTPDFIDARKAAIAAMQSAGLQIVADEKIPKTAGKAETDATAANLSKAGAEVVYVLMSPTIYLNFTKSIHGQVTYDPDLVGPGLTVGLNLVAQAGCPDVAKTQVLSPFPQLDAIDSLDPDYKTAYSKYVTAKNPQQQPDDIGLALWGLDKTLALMFQSVGPTADKLSRQSFLAGVTSGQEFKSNVYPTVKFSPSQHFGATTSHLLQAQCTPPPQFKTAATFVSGF